MIENWKLAREKDRLLYWKLVCSLAFMILALNRFSVFALAVESRQGAVLNDPFLALFAPIDLTWITFALIYGLLAWGITTMMFYPYHFIRGAITYGGFVLFRILTMKIVPLDPPVHMIALEDPIVQIFGTGTPVVLTRDLFFSGHTSSVFMLCVNAINRRFRLIFAVGTALVGACVLLQHVHYTIDVVAAPFFTYAAYRISRKLIPN